MADTMFALARVRRTQASDLLPDTAIVQSLGSMSAHRRERLLTPVVMVRLFLMQILFGNTSITHLRQLSGEEPGTVTYFPPDLTFRFRIFARGGKNRGETMRTSGTP